MARIRKESVGQSLDRIDAVLKITEKQREEYGTFLDYYRGLQWKSRSGIFRAPIGRFDAGEPVVVNYSYNTIRTIVPTLYFKNPRMFANAAREEFLDRVPLVNLVSNYDFRALNVKEEVKRTILRAQIGGIAYFETGYSFLEEEIEKEPELSLVVPSPEEPVSEEPEEKKVQFSDMRIIQDSPSLISRSLMEVVVDPYVNQHSEVPWYAIREIKPIEMVKKDPRFKNVKNLKPNAKFDKVVVNTFSEEYRKSSDLKFLEMWHYTDRWKGKTFTIARGHKGKLREFDTPDGYGLVPLVFNEDPESNFHISTIKVFRDQQDEINRMRMYMLEHVKRTLPRMVVDSDKASDEEDMNRVTSSDLSEIVQFPGGSDAIKPLQFATLSPDLYAVDRKLIQDMTVSSGLSDFQRGKALKVPSATEAQLIEQSSRLRVDEGLDTVSDAVVQAMTNIFKLRQKFTTGEQTVPIIGEDNLDIWKEFETYTREMIQGEFEFTVDYGSTQKKDQDFEKTQWLQLAPILTNLKLQSRADPSLNLIGRSLMKAFERPQSEIDLLFPMQTPETQLPGPPGQAPVSPEAVLSILGGAR